MMKERPSSKLVRGARQESRRFRLLVIVVGFFLVSLTFVVVSKPDAILFGLSGKLPADEAPASILIQQPVDKQAPVVASEKIPTGALGGDPKVVDDEADVKPKEIRDGKEEDSNVLSEPDPASGMTDPTHNKDGSGHKPDSEMLGEERKDKEKKVTLPTVSNYTIHDNEDPSNAKQEDQALPSEGDEFCLSHITELTVKSSKVAAECTRYHEVPAVIFSLTGYTGNLFHDFTDVMVPLFTTASQFNGEVHCFKHAIVGLHSYMEFTIDATKSPHGVTMVDFNRFMRGAYSLGKDTAVMLGENPKVKPRLLIIKRHRTRMFLNLDEIIAMAEGLGFEVVIDEANVSSDISGFAKLVNSVDVMMGVHGAGLTNCVFLPQNATLIQIVPWGGLDWISRVDFGDPAEMMGLRYKQYAIGVDESSLTDQYPRDHEIFKNPISFHKRGFEFIRHTFMDKQNVKLDCKRFRPILLEALDNLNP
ncbi:hypothetical protein ACQ4PT_035025 [Festuca glaucescens]